MTGSLIPFESNGWKVRTLNIDGEPWFVAKDVCSSLGLSNSRMAVADLDDDEKSDVSISYISSNGVSQRRSVGVINEPGLYSLILRSRKSQAKAFKRWVTHEVIPSIRKTGGYGHMIPTTLPEALRLAADQAERIAELEPKAEEWGLIAKADGTFSLSDTAKNLGWGPVKFVEKLRDDGILFYRGKGSRRVNIPFQKYLDQGLFIVLTIAVDPLRQQTRVTGKGKLWLSRKYSRRLGDAQ